MAVEMTAVQFGNPGKCEIKLAYRYLDSPVGQLLVAGKGEVLHYLSFPTGHKAMKPADTWVKDLHGFDDISSQLTAYFHGECKTFDLSLHLTGTDFQRSVWAALLDIPFGQTTSYGALARTLGNPKASRAVGAANGANPIPIIVPCHRVIGSNKSLTGFGGGIGTKEFLLKHEGILTEEFSFL
jgi:methylated-DNA-[protein]-cysteine S-methyltransferase